MQSLRQCNRKKTIPSLHACTFWTEVRFWAEYFRRTASPFASTWNEALQVSLDTYDLPSVSPLTFEDSSGSSVVTSVIRRIFLFLRLFRTTDDSFQLRQIANSTQISTSHKAALRILSKLTFRNHATLSLTTCVYLLGVKGKLCCKRCINC